MLLSRYVIITLLLLVGCSGGPGPPIVPATGRRAILHVPAGGRSVAEDLVTRLREARIDAQVLPLAELPEDVMATWIQESEAGDLVVVVAASQCLAAEAVRDAWSRPISVTAPRETTPPHTEPLALGEAGPLPEALRDSIRAELARRREVDQAVRKDPARHHEMASADADNTTWLRTTVVAHGWIDVERFGKVAAEAAFLIVQHSGDLPLMLAALEQIERDVRAGQMDGQSFALLHDRLQLMQGGQQRYGTQILQDPVRGDWVLGPLEDPEEVDERRREIGLEPLARYLSRFEGEVRIER